MAVKVEIINNPYTQRMKILINNETISVYSNLEKYIGEPFWYWCDKILDSIYEECNYGEFRLHFCSRTEEIKVMEKLAGNYQHCVQYSSSPLTRSTSLLERMKDLHNLIRNSNGMDYHGFKKSVLFVIPESLNRLESDLAGMEVRNSYCQLNSNVVYFSDFEKRHQSADICFLISPKINLSDYIEKLGFERNFAISLASENCFQGKRGELFLYESTERALFDTIFECLLLFPLAEIFYSCVSTLKYADRYKGNIEELQSIEFKVIPIPENTTIEVGTSRRIKFETDMKGYEIKGSQLNFSYTENGIIRCNGMLVEGIKPGKVTLHIFKEGEKLPCASVNYTVIKRNRIRELKLEDDILIIGEGDYEGLNLNYFPTDADNIDTIEWQSDDEKVAVVDRGGRVKGIAEGNCTIRCFAEQVSVSCDCIVKRHLKSITTNIVGELEMIYGQEKEIQITLEPERTIDGEIVLSSIDMQVANIIGKTVKAVGCGCTKVVIQNREGTVRTDIPVRVMTEWEYQKLQKQRQNGSTINEKKKRGLLSRLFG